MANLNKTGQQKNSTAKFSISREAYDKYRQKKGSVSNARLRPEGESFFDAMMSVDMNETTDGRKILDAIRNLG